MGVGQQDRPHVLGREAQLAHRVEDLVAATRIPGVDEQHAVVVGHQRPVHQVGLGEVDGVGDTGEGCRHAAQAIGAGRERSDRGNRDGVKRNRG